MLNALVLIILLVRIVHANDIVLKSSFPWPGTQFPGELLTVRTYPPIDVDNDGFPEVFCNQGYFNTVTMELYYPGDVVMLQYPQLIASIPVATVAVMRQLGLAEYTSYASSSAVGPWGLRVYDVMSGELLLHCAECSGNLVSDYDNDGLDDILTVVADGSAVRVYGVANGNPVSPPHEVDIQVSGEDCIVTWNSVPGATAYRVLWSSSIDGTSFTRIGYTSETSFVHRNRASEPMGFYRVMSEDNGTGVVRMVGQSDRGPK